MKNVTYYDGVYGEEKKYLLENMHYFVLPTSYKDETLPISMLEAMASGLYIITTDVTNVSTLLKSSTNDLSIKIQDIILQTSATIKINDFNISKMKDEYSNKMIQKSIFKVIES